MVKLESVLYILCVGNMDDPAVSSGYWSLLSEGSFLEVPILEISRRFQFKLVYSKL